MKYIITGLGKGTHQVEAKNLFELGGGVDKNELDNRYVPLEGRTTINGTKTFTEAPIVPTPTLDTHAVNKEYVDSSIRVQGEQLPFISTWDVAAGEEIVLPVGTEGNNSISVDWGDGTINTEHSHTYTTAGTYNIEITGNLEDFRFNGSNVSKDNITAITQWGGIEWRRFNFRGCTNLSDISAVDYPILNNVDSLLWAFGNCPITIIPEDIFTLASNVTDFSFVFRGHNATSIPVGLFDNCLSAVLFISAFKGGALASVPEGIFRGCINARSFRGVFRDNAITSIAEDIFANCLLVEDMGNAFFINLLTEVPADIFKYNRKISNLDEAFRYNDITEPVPPLWLDFPDAPAVNCFQHATDAPNYSEIPEVWGGPVGVPMPPQVPVDHRNYWNESTNKPQWLINGVWYDAGTGSGGSTSKPPVDETYADVTALLADQNNQEQDYFYEVTDASGLTTVSSGAAVLLYNASTPTGTESDYIIIWAENPIGIVEQPLTDSATVNWNVSENQVARLLATSAVGNTRTITLSNSSPGVNYQLTYIQDATGGRELDLSGFDKVYGAIDLSPNAESIITVMVTNAGTSFVVITSDVSIDEFREVILVDDIPTGGTFDINRQTKKPVKYNIHTDSLTTSSEVTINASNLCEDIIITSLSQDDSALILNVNATPTGYTNIVKAGGTVYISTFEGLYFATGDLIKEYEITASPDGTLWKTGQIDNSGNPVAPTAL